MDSISAQSNISVSIVWQHPCFASGSGSVGDNVGGVRGMTYSVEVNGLFINVENSLFTSVTNKPLFQLIQADACQGG